MVDVFEELSYPEDEGRILRLFKRMFPDADSVRIVTPNGKLFLILGKERNTRDDVGGTWHDSQGRVKHFDYMQETTVASGETLERLVESAEFYRDCEKKKLSDYVRFFYGECPLANFLAERGI